MGNLADYVFINRNIHDSLHKSSFLTNFSFARIQTQAACCSFLHKFHNIHIEQSLTVWILREEWVSEKRYRIKKKRHGSDNMFCNARVKVPQNQKWMIRFHILDFSEIWNLIIHRNDYIFLHFSLFFSDFRLDLKSEKKIV